MPRALRVCVGTAVVSGLNASLRQMGEGKDESGKRMWRKLRTLEQENWEVGLFY